MGEPAAAPAEEFATYTDEQLVTLFWYSDALTVDEDRALETELKKRGIDATNWEKQDG